MRNRDGESDGGINNKENEDRNGTTKIDRDNDKKASGSAVKRRIARVISITGSVDVIIRRADELADRGQHIAALGLYRRALSLCPEDEEIRLLIADTLLEMNCFTESMGELAPMLTQGGAELRQVIFRLAHCMLGRNEFKAARELFLLAIADGGEDDASEPLGYEDAANTFECLDICEQYLDGERQDRRTLRDADELLIERALQSAGELSEQGRFEEAIPITESAYGEHPESLELFTDLLLDYYCAKRYDEGRRIYESARPAFKDDLTVRCCAAMIYSALGMKREEDECCERILAFETEQVSELVRAFTVMMELSRFDKARHYAQKLRSIEPYNRNFNHFLAQALYELGDFDEAKRLYELSLRIAPHDSVAHFYRESCKKTIEDEQYRPIRIEYAVPPTEFLRRVERSEELSELGISELKALYETNRDELLILTDWALSDKNSPYGDMFLMMLSEADPTLAEGMIRRLLVEPDCSEELRKMAAVRLHYLAKETKFMLYSDGGISICSFGEGPIRYSDWPDCYRRIITSVCTELASSAQELIGAAARLCYLYTLDNYRTRPRLPYGQVEAMSAAIVYFLLRESEAHETPDIAAFAAAHGVTVKRIENALARLLTVTIPDENDGPDLISPNGRSVRDEITQSFYSSKAFKTDMEFFGGDDDDDTDLVFFGDDDDDDDDE